MNCTTRAWEETPPIPWNPEDVWLDSCPAVSEYLMSAFEASFGARPVEATYSAYPDGVYACLIVDGKLMTKHNVWGSVIASKLRRSGLDLNVYVRSLSEFEEAKERHVPQAG